MGLRNLIAEPQPLPTYTDSTVGWNEKENGYSWGFKSMGPGNKDRSSGNQQSYFSNNLTLYLERENILGKDLFWLTVQRHTVHHGKEGMGRNVGQLVIFHPISGGKEQWMVELSLLSPFSLFIGPAALGQGLLLQH